MSDVATAAHRQAARHGRPSSLRQRSAVTATFVAHGLLFASWTAHIPQVKAHLGLSDPTLGLILLAAPVGSVLAMVITGRLLPAWGSRRLVRATLVGYCLAGPLVGLADAPGTLAAALLSWGAFQGALDVAMNTQAVSVQSAQKRRLMPGFHGGWSIGSFAGAGIGTLAVAMHISVTPQLLALAFPVLGTAGVLSASMIKHDQVGDYQRAPRPDRPHLPRAAFVLGAIAFATMLCEGATANWSAVYLRGSLDLNAAIAGLGYAAFAFAAAAVRLSGRRLLARIEPSRLLPALAAVATLGMSVGLTTGEPIAALIGFACLGLGTGLIIPTVFTAAGNLPELPAGTAIAAVTAFGWAGFVCGPPLIGQLANVAGLRGALAVLPTLAFAITITTARSDTLYVDHSGADRAATGTGPQLVR